jgi:hypothetical protein
MSADRNKDDIAAALHGVHADDSVASHEHRNETPQQPPPALAPIPQQPKTAKSRPAMPSATPPSAPARSAGSSRPSQSGASRPAAPGVRPATPQQSSREEMYVEDDPDEIPGLPAGATLDYRGATRPAARFKRTPFFKTRGFRQTMIPILLTSGVASLAFAVAHWVVDENAPLARLPGWASPVLILLALLLLASAVVNMLFVRAELTKPK